MRKAGSLHSNTAALWRCSWPTLSFSSGPLRGFLAAVSTVHVHWSCLLFPAPSHLLWVQGSVSSWTSPPSARGMPGTATEDCVTPRKAHGLACNHYSGPRSWKEGPPTGKAKTCPPHNRFSVLNYGKRAPRPSRKEAQRSQVTVLVAKQVDRKTRTAPPGRFCTQESLHSPARRRRKKRLLNWHVGSGMTWLWVFQPAWRKLGVPIS